MVDMGPESGKEKIQIEDHKVGSSLILITYFLLIGSILYIAYTFRTLDDVRLTWIAFAAAIGVAVSMLNTIMSNHRTREQMKLQIQLNAQANQRQQDEWSKREIEARDAERAFLKKIRMALRSELEVCLNSVIAAIKHMEEPQNVFDDVRSVFFRFPHHVRDNIFYDMSKLDEALLQCVSLHDAKVTAAFEQVSKLTNASSVKKVDKALYNLVYWLTLYLSNLDGPVKIETPDFVDEIKKHTTHKELPLDVVQHFR